MLNPKKLFPIGIGTWGVGGFMEIDNSLDFDKQTGAITYMLNKGMNFAEANMWYSEGKSVEILANALKKSDKKREDIFICQAIYIAKDKTFAESKKEIEKILKMFGTDYLDTLQFSQESFLNASFNEISDWIHELINQNTIRFTSLTNANLELLEKYAAEFGDSFFSHEASLNFEVRENQENGVLDYVNEIDAKNVIYQPLRRNRSAGHNWPLLVELSEKYGKKQNQIILNWMIAKDYLPITKSETIAHIDEHLEALAFEMEPKDIKKVDTFRVPSFEPPKVAWKYGDEGTRIDQLSNVFDEEYEKQNG